jgi:hypothetical protein
MALYPDEIPQLHLAICEAFPTAGTLELLVQFALGCSVNAISAPAEHPLLVLNVIKWADTNGRITNLIVTAMNRNSGNTTLGTYGPQILARLAQNNARPWYQPPNHHETCFVSGPQAFINRIQLRTFFQELNSPLGSSVLAVNGPKASGKSYSLRFIIYLNRALNNYKMAWMDLTEELYAELRPEDLMRKIAIQAGFDSASIPGRASMAARYAKELCEWLAVAAAQLQTPLIVVLDGFHQPELHGETRELVIEMIKRISMGDTRIRLVMLNYDVTTLPASTRALIKKETTGPLGRSDLTNFFTAVYKHKGREPDATIIDSIVDKVLSAMPPDPPSVNEAINELVTEAAKALD